MFARRSTSTAAFALGESLVAIAVLAFLASSSLYALFAANRFVVQQRLLSSAKALCQERIDEALIQPLSLTKVPQLYGGAWPLPAAETLTSTEAVPLYVPETSANVPSVTGTRRTWVTGYTPVAGNPSFVFARVRVRVEFWYQGRGFQNKRSTAAGAVPFFYEMTTLRSPD